MTITFTDDTASITLDDLQIEVTLSIKNGAVVVSGYAQKPGNYLSLDFEVRQYGGMWEPDVSALFDEYSYDRDTIRTAVTYTLVAIDQWATPERFAQAKVADAQAKVDAAKQAQERANADLLAAEASLAKARAKG